MRPVRLGHWVALPVAGAARARAGWLAMKAEPWAATPKPTSRRAARVPEGRPGRPGPAPRAARAGTGRHPWESLGAVMARMRLPNLARPFGAPAIRTALHCQGVHRTAGETRFATFSWQRRRKKVRVCSSVGLTAEKRRFLRTVRRHWSPSAYGAFGHALAQSHGR